MRPGRALLALLAGVALLAPAAARAQRDTIRLGGDPEPRDTITLVAEDTAPARPERPARWSQPFAVEGSGEVAPRPPAREVVWLPADSVRARRLAARRDSAGNEADELAASDSAADETDQAAEADSAPPPPRRAGSRTASRDTASAGRRTGRTTRADTASTGRRTARNDDEGDDEAAAEAPRPTRRTSPRDTTATTRRSASRDTATTRRSASRDTTGTRRTALRDTASRRTTARPRTHRVAAGETLFGIARRYSVTSAQIRALNPDLGETLEIGTVLRLPAGARAPGQPAASRDDGERTETRRPSASRDEDGDRPAPARPSTRARRHTVAAGETLYGIARRYGVTVDALRSANRLESDTVRPGQALTIPAAPPAQR